MKARRWAKERMVLPSERRGLMGIDGKVAPQDMTERLPWRLSAQHSGVEFLQMPLISR